MKVLVLLLLLALGAGARELPAWLPARWFTPGRPGPVRLVVLHSTEGGTARSVAGMFASGESRTSAHYVIDASETIACVREEDQAWGAPGANAAGVHVEICGWARWTSAEWQASGVLPRVAHLVAGICARHGLPVERVDVAGLKSGARGITTHADVSQAFGQTDHTDPGPGFPLADVIASAGGRA